MGLFTPSWKTGDRHKQDKAVKAVEKVKREDELFEIATTAPLPAVRVAATNRIADEQMLYRIAVTQKGDYSDTCHRAIGRIRDDALLEKLAVELSGYAQEEVMRRVRNEDALVGIVLNPKDDRSARNAFDRLRSQSAFARVALGDADESLRGRAIGQLTDTIALSKLARDETNDRIRWQAIQQLVGQGDAKQYAEFLRDYRGDAGDVLQTVNRHVFDAMALLVIASGTDSDEIREKCLERLNRPGLCADDHLSADQLNTILQTCDDPAVRESARKRLEDLKHPARRADSSAASQKYVKPFGEDTGGDRMTMSTYKEIVNRVNALPEAELLPAYAAQVRGANVNFNFANRGEYWRTIESEILRRVQDKPERMLDFVRDPDAAWPMAKRCVAELFKLPGDREDSERLQDEAVGAFLRNIPDYVAMSGKNAAPREEKHFLAELAEAIPSACRERFGFESFHKLDSFRFRGKLYTFG